MKDKRVLITGATAGIGFETAKQLAEKGAEVVIIARNEEKKDSTVKALQEAVPGATFHGLSANLSSLEEVKEVAEAFRAEFKTLDVLINNAGLVVAEHILSEDGYELQFAVNHLAPFYLTNLLLDLLKKAPQRRIVNVSSEAHYRGKLSLNRVIGPQNSYKAMAAYSQSKLCNVLFTKKLASMLEGTQVTVNALHPGVVRTGIGNRNNTILSLSWTLMKPFMRSAAKGAGTSVFLASDPSVAEVSGCYFDQNQKRKEASELARNEELAEELWDFSVDAVGL